MRNPEQFRVKLGLFGHDIVDVSSSACPAGSADRAYETQKSHFLQSRLSETETVQHGFAAQKKGLAKKANNARALSEAGHRCGDPVAWVLTGFPRRDADRFAAIGSKQLPHRLCHRWGYRESVVPGKRTAKGTVAGLRHTRDIQAEMFRRVCKRNAGNLVLAGCAAPDRRTDNRTTWDRPVWSGFGEAMGGWPPFGAKNDREGASPTIFRRTTQGMVRLTRGEAANV